MPKSAEIEAVHNVYAKSAAHTVPRFRHFIVALLLVGGMINYIDRSTLSIAGPAMVKDLGFSMTEIGLMGTAFAWCYAIAQIPTGWISDRVSARLIFGFSLVAWSLATSVTGLVSTLGVMLVSRALLGVFEAPCWPVATKIISVWFPRQERGVAIGIFTSSAKWGPAIAPPLLVAIMLSFGWRGIFIISGIAGIAFGLAFYLLYRNPNQSKRLSSQELDFINAGGGGVEHILDPDKQRISWGSLFTYRSVWGLVFGYFCAIWIWNTFVVFLPMYLSHTYHVSIAKIALYASLPWIGGGVGSVSSGFIARWVASRFEITPLKANQRLVASYALFTAISLVCTGLLHNFLGTVALMTVTLFFVSAINSSAWTMASEIAPPSMISSVSSIQNFGGYFGGAFAPLLAGFIVDRTGSYTLAFFVAGAIAAFGAISYLWIVKKPIDHSDGFASA
ncbi:MFS transporter [Paraburkholderia domus]|uniref:MFS transporter n=1 Tax=Paraburkholderia domus TaxID=2793075 RepID=UPI000A430991|nr:MFS transporter [Paraburkholderia domus]MBK5186008.1 MFS transporter [Burkholderia sp. R-69749]CAE6898127.1 putative L-galactonate transporter [Paraburkholderia domus]